MAHPLAVELGVPYLRGPLGHGLKYLRDKSLGCAAVNVVVGERMGQKVRASGVAAARVRVIQNWSNDEDLIPVTAVDNPLRRAWQLEDRLVVGYSGNLGRAHEFDTILRAAEHLRDNSQIIFLFVGGGHSFDELALRFAACRLFCCERLILSPAAMRSSLIPGSMDA